MFTLQEMIEINNSRAGEPWSLTPDGIEGYTIPTREALRYVKKYSEEGSLIHQRALALHKEIVYGHMTTFDPGRSFCSPYQAIKYCETFENPKDCLLKVIGYNWEQGEYGFAKELAQQAEFMCELTFGCNVAAYLYVESETDPDRDVYIFSYCPDNDDDHDHGMEVARFKLTDEEREMFGISWEYAYLCYPDDRNGEVTAQAFWDDDDPQAGDPKLFRVKVSRASWSEAYFEVQAKDEAEAENKAAELASNHEFGSGNAEYEFEVEEV